MSNAKTPIKILRVAYRRIQKGFFKGGWSNRNRQTGVTEVCIEGAIYGFTSRNDKNPACKMACDIVMQIINEQYPGQFVSIPDFNDAPATTQLMAENVLKMALVRAETGGLIRDDEEECWE